MKMPDWLIEGTTPKDQLPAVPQLHVPVCGLDHEFGWPRATPVAINGTDRNSTIRRKLAAFILIIIPLRHEPHSIKPKPRSGEDAPIPRSGQLAPPAGSFRHGTSLTR